MGNLFSRNYQNAERCAPDALSYCRKDEVIDVDDEFADEVRSDDSSVEIIGAGANVKNSEENMVEERNSSSEITDMRDGNLDVDSATKMFSSLSLDCPVGDALNVEAQKKSLDSTEKHNSRLKELGLRVASWMQPEKQIKELPHEPFLPLSEEEEVEVKRAFSANYWKVLVSHKNSNIDITGLILQCLRPGRWLNDEVINLYLGLLKERETREPHKFLRCHFFNTFFYKKLVGAKAGYDYQAVRRWTSVKKLGYHLIDCDKIFVPIHREIHWTLAVINKKDQKFQYLDALKGNESRLLIPLARYFVEEAKDKSDIDIDISSWELEFVEDAPEQKNRFDCGMFMVKYIDFYSRGLGLCFSQEHMPYFRKRLAKEILRLRAE